MNNHERHCVRSGLAAIGFVAAAACAHAPAPPPPAAPPPIVIQAPLTPAEVEAAAVLLRLEDRREFNVSVIEAASSAEESSIRARAALAAGRIGTLDGARIVRSLLLDPDTSVAAAAAFMAGQLRDSSTVSTLLGLLQAEDASGRPLVAAEAASALGKIATEEARFGLASFLDNTGVDDTQLSPAVQEALIGSWRSGETATQPYLKWLESPAPGIRWRAAYALARRPRPDAVRALLPMLTDSDPLTRTFSIRGLGASLVGESGASRDEVLSRLLQATQDSAYTVRVEAIRALGTYWDPASVAALEELAFSDSPHEAVIAIESLARIGPSAAGRSVPTLRVLLDQTDTPDYIRGAVLEAAMTLDPPGALELVRTRLDDPSWRVRSAAARSLTQRLSEGLALLADLVRDTDPRVAAAAIDAAVTGAGEDSIQQIRTLLLEQLENTDLHVRAAVVRGLALLKDPAIYPALLDAYDRARYDPEPEAALAVIDAIGDLGATAAIFPERAFFTRFSRPDDPLVRLRAATRFGDAARAAWGDPLPIETRTQDVQYRQYVEDWLAPAPPARDLPRVRIETDLGTIEAVLFGDEAPLTVLNFISLAEAGYFDRQEWPRIVPNFVAQGGDPRGDTSGGPGYTIRDELNRSRYGTGTLGMALAGPDTGGSQFFITHSPQPHLDGTYTVFGRVLSGQEVIEKLLPGHRIISIRLIRDEV